MILAYNEAFEQPITDGIKIHTMREDAGHRWRKGIRIHMAVHVRTKRQRTFNDRHVCTGTQEVVMQYKNKALAITIDGRELTFKEKMLLAHRDGFATISSFEQWFIPLCVARPRKVYRCRLIHWTNTRY